MNINGFNRESEVKPWDIGDRGIGRALNSTVRAAPRQEAG